LADAIGLDFIQNREYGFAEDVNHHFDQASPLASVFDVGVASLPVTNVAVFRVEGRIFHRRWMHE